ncbi:hypothetical protein [Granulicella sp. dw_53]|uniref:hypothetical protein n=1 Tax=Granulicella sp. dw_53 TaxID=2719792 RepID=UPI002103FC20|nr:hypothetical protein [Granulicella sp. dw_53]
MVTRSDEGAAVDSTSQVPDIGSWVNAVIATLPTVTQNGQVWARGSVTIPAYNAAGNYDFSTTIVLDSPYVNLHCEPGVILTYTGSGDAIRILPHAQIAGSAATQPNQGPSVDNCSIYNTSASAISGIHAGDISKIHLTNVAVNNFNGTPTSSAYWFDNTVSFTEGLALVDITSSNNSIAMRFTNTVGTAFSNSFGYTSIRGFRAGIRTNQIGFSVEEGTFLYHSYIDGILETSDASGTVMSVSGTGKVGGNQGDDVLFLRAECVNGSGSCTGATLLKLGAATQFVANGFMNALGVTMKTSIAPGAVFHWQGTTQLNNTDNRSEWASDGSIHLVWNTNTRALLSPSNLRVDGSTYVLGWSTNPTANPNFLGLSPCGGGIMKLCLGNGTYADSSAPLKAGQIAASQFIGSSLVPTVVPGPGAGSFPTAVSLTPGSTNVSGTVLFTTGASPVAVSAAVTVLFATPLAQAPNVCIPTAQNAATGTALNNLIISSPATTGFVIFSGFVALTASTTYQLGYACF